MNLIKMHYVCPCMKFPIYKYEYIRKEYSNREKSISDKGHGLDKESSVWSPVLKGRLTMF